MAVVATTLKSLIDAEMALVDDPRIVSHIKTMLVEPFGIMRDWDYGAPGQQYLCWVILQDPVTEAAIGYCEDGFGPTCPWGLIGTGEDRRMGMDSGWFASFMDAYFDSWASTTLPIWRVLRVEADGTEIPLTAEGTWEATWREVMLLRKSDGTRRYDCGHGISYGQSATRLPKQPRS